MPYCLKPALPLWGTAIGSKTLKAVRTLWFPSNRFWMFSFQASTYFVVKQLSCSSMWGVTLGRSHLWSLPFSDKSSFNLAKCLRWWPTSSRPSTVYSIAGAMYARQIFPSWKVLLKWLRIGSTSCSKYTVPRNFKLHVYCKRLVAVASPLSLKARSVCSYAS